ncbi:hypothetical protein SADUNF_Sadunf18G0082300 [Salix dunnii]|uniref:Uncharacterized protein n=1 Tax=Salix dunnii TaxID=1413687 RepID=A0A835MDS2_9ROSI|nr:hypothetical protein SADUNF_Sadunf18G0082300 [Salix dunnii]
MVARVSGAYEEQIKLQDLTDKVVTVVHFCSKGCAEVINLSRDTFSQIANPDDGKVVIHYD